MEHELRCIICDDLGKLTILGKIGLESISSCSLERGDGLVDRISIDGKYGIHEKCRKHYTKATNIAAFVKGNVSCRFIEVESSQDKVLVTSHDFSWERDCFVCSKQLKMKNKYGKVRQVCYLRKSGKLGRSQDRILAACGHMCDTQSMEVSNRIRSVEGDLTFVGARYHKDCMKQFMQKDKNDGLYSDQSLSQLSEPIVSSLTSTVPLQVASVGLPTYNIGTCNGVMSHQDYLINFGYLNNLNLVDTVGNGNCFFDAVRQCVARLGLIRTVRELRLAAALELNLNSELYKYVYLTEHEAGQHQQSTTYEEFVRQTRVGLEWATQITVAAMAKSLDLVITLVSTTSNSVTNSPSVFVQNYSDGVNNVNKSIIIGFNRMTAHYIGFISLVGAPIDLGSVNAISRGDGEIVLQVASASNDERSAKVVRVNAVVADVDCESEMDVDENVVLQDVVIDSTHVNVNNVISIQCKNCLRASTPVLNLDVLQVTCKYTDRKYRLVPRSNGVCLTTVLCCDCRKYLQAGCKFVCKSLWVHGWPAVIACLLTQKQHGSIRGAIWKMLPSIHRESWSQLAAIGGLDESQSCDFVDFSSAILRYHSRIESGSIKEFVAAMDETCFPCVKCPAGCFAFLEECDSLALNHFLAWKFDLSLFSGDHTLLEGARSDWPMSSLQLGRFAVTPGMTVTESGLCILLCKFHGGSLRKPIVHVPRHPVLGDLGFQLPDVDAAAVLTPNVIRAGRMGKWTNSSHVVKAIGGYSGISSSCIAQRVDVDIVDERLARATFLAINHREDVRRTVQIRYLVLPDGISRFQKELELYDRYLKPGRDIVQQCLLGGTVILAADAFGMHSSFFSRDTETGNRSEVSEKNSVSLVFALVHPPTAHGRHPFDVSSQVARSKRNEVVHALLRLSMHCSYVHNVLLRKFNLNGSLYIGKLLGLVKKLVCPSVRVTSVRGFRDVKEAQEGTVSEMTRLKIAKGKAHCQTVANILCAISPDQIVSYVVPDVTAVQDVVIDCNFDVVVMYRLSSRLYKNVLPVQLGDYKLFAGFGDQSNLSQFYFRWQSNFKFWQVRSQESGQSSTMTEAGGSHQSGLLLPLWQLLVYVNVSKTDSINNALLKPLGGQDKMFCRLHSLFLVKKSINCRAICCVKHCERNARWLCLAKGLPCSHGVCFSHGRDMLRGPAVVDVFTGIAGRRLKSGVSAPTLAAGVQDASDEFSASSGCDSDGEIFAPILQEDPCDISSLPALHSRRDMIPVYDVSRDIPGHFLWNKGYGIMRRRMHVHPSVESNAMMQHIVSITDSPCVSLLYPEGQLFPRTFWKSDESAVVGAMPSFMLNCFSNSMNHGLESLSKHHAIRLRDGDLLTSKQNSYWHYVFDLSLNQQLTRFSSKLVFKRGLEFLLEDNSHQSRATQGIAESSLPMDEAEATRRIKELASLLKKGKWTYFVTITINESETPGIRELTRAVRQFAAGDQEKERELTDAYLPFMLRVWERFVRVLLQELVMRNDSIIGKVHHMFYRFEFQGAGSQGNKPHVHMGVTLEEEPEQASLDRICCSSVEFATSMFGTDFQSLLRQGLVSNEAEFNAWCDVFAIVNTHDCNRAGGRCMKATNSEGDKICRYRRQPVMPLEAVGRHWFEPVDVPYSDEVYGILEEMGLAGKELDVLRNCERWVLRDSLLAGKWHYRARGDEFFMASIPLLSAITRSATNVDMCDRHFQVSYLVKYVSGKEERNLTEVSGSKVMDELKVTTQEHAHEKITGCKRIADKKALTREHSGREVCLAEVVWFILGFRYTYCTADFVSIQTMPLASRAAIRKYASTNVDQGTAADKRLAAGLVSWRQFTVGQEAHMDEYLKSSLYLDTTSAFNLRPPELLIFNNLQLYNECFVAVRVANSPISTNLAAAAWLDGIGRQVKLYSCSIDKCLAFLNQRLSEEGNSIAAQLLAEVFLPIKLGDTVLHKIFVKYVDAREIVSVISFAKPWDRTKFLTHLCLSLGQYETEMDVFCSGSIKDAFVKVGLLTSSSVISRSDVLCILKRYIISDLAFHPISARAFSRYVQSAMDTLCDVFLNDAVGNYTPCMSEVALKDQATQQLKNCEATRRSNLIAGLFDDVALSSSLPPDLQTASLDAPLRWTPSITGTAAMSVDSVREQSQALAWCVRVIDTFLNPSCRGVKFPVIVGRPGSGKSFVLKMACAYALSKGLAVELMSFTSERARTLGGNHMHSVFPLPVRGALVCPTHTIVSECIANLQKDPLKLALIKRTDVYFYEEIGLLSAQLFGALDSILQFVMDNTLPMGGKLFICSGDSKQLPPVSGQPIWSSVLMCTLMDVLVFKSDVRAVDPNLRWLNDQCRRELDPVECAAVADRVLAHCRVVASWSLVPSNAVRIVSTRAAEEAVMCEFLSNKATRDFVAIDRVQNNTDWVPAVEAVTRRLNKSVYEYGVCRLFVDAVVRMTFNERRVSAHGSSMVFSQGQLAVVVGLPDESRPLREQKLTLRLAPPGERTVVVGNIPDTWKTELVGRRTTLPTVVGRCLQMATREQFPVRYHLTSTIHRIQGETVPLYATQISESDRHYRLWQKEQFTVLISRAQRCDDIIFVGSIAETRHAIVNILSRTSKWDRLVDSYMTSLDVLSRPPVREVRLELHPFTPLYRELPSAACGYVYLLASIADCRKCFVGETDDLKKSLRQHNTGYGTAETRPTELHPWGVYAFICGFETDDPDLGHSHRRDFMSSLRFDCLRGPDSVYDSMLSAVADHRSLVIVKCGEIRVV